jgi:hypothetical protein
VSYFKTLDSDPVPGDTIRNIRSPSIVLRVTLVGKHSGHEISARALLDSGAEGIIMDKTFADRHQLTLRTLTQPLPVRNVDGTFNLAGTVKHTTIQVLRIKTPAGNYHEEQTELYVTTLGDQDIIFGTDWLHAHNPEVNWARPQLAFTRCPPTCTLSQTPLIIESSRPVSKHTTINRLNPDPEPNLDNDILDLGLEVFLSIQYLAKHDSNEPLTISAKTTTATDLAAKTAPRPSENLVPEQYHGYSKVFSEKASHRLPQHQPWDHTIDLVPSSTLKKCTVYRLTPSESITPA